MRAVSPTTTAPKTAVFFFQLDGCAYQPPAGDQTCLGYLYVDCQPRWRQERRRSIVAEAVAGMIEEVRRKRHDRRGD